MLLVCFQRTIVDRFDRFKKSGGDGSLIGRGEGEVGGPSDHRGSEVGGREHQVGACPRLPGRGAQAGGGRGGPFLTDSWSFVGRWSLCVRFI